MLATLKKKKDRQNYGFSLAETAMVIMISGLILGTAAMAARPATESVQTTVTEKRMERISKSMSLYAQRHNRLPCPAMANPAVEPFGSERGSGAGGDSYATTCIGNDTEGLVPFRALGLQEADIRDAYGNFFTYRVSPVFAVNPNDIAAADLDTVHERCRVDDWMNTDDSLTAGHEFDLVAMVAENPFVLEDDTSGITISQNYHGNTSEDSSVTFFEDAVTHNSKTFRKSRVDYEISGLFSDGGPGWEDTDGWFCCSTLDDVQKYYEFNATGDGISEIDITVAFNPRKYDDAESGGDVIYAEIWTDDPDADPVVVEIDPFSGDLESPKAYHNTLALKSSEITDGEDITRMRLFSTGHLSFVINAVELGGGAGTTVANKNPAKARFCCPTASSGDYAPATDLVIQDPNGMTVWPYTRDGNGTQYGDIDTTTSDPVDGNSYAPAYVLVSHGKNGAGAFLANGTAKRFADAGEIATGIGSDETENMNGDNVFVIDNRNSTMGNAHYDDVILWRTQDQVYSEFGNDSCARPYVVSGSPLSGS